MDKTLNRRRFPGRAGEKPFAVNCVESNVSLLTLIRPSCDVRCVTPRTCTTRRHLACPPGVDASQEVRLGRRVAANDRQVESTLDSRVLHVTDVRTSNRYVPHARTVH